MSDERGTSLPHTPAPWTVIPAYRSAPAGVMDRHGHVIADVFGGAHAAAEADARLIAAAPALVDSLLAVEWAGEDDGDDFPDRVDCCPNCGAHVDQTLEPRGTHYRHCELRDALDAALGISSPRIVHPAHVKEAR